MRVPLDPKVGKRARVVVGERLGEQPRDEAFVIPDLEKVLLPQHVDFAGHQGALAKPGLDQDASLGVEFRDLAVRDAYLVDPVHQAVGGRIVAELDGGADGVFVFDVAV